ncbi:MAG: DUF1344 domain-containing protein [Rhizobiaceae bacterium]|nr:DUF1344 domain-containing protein [Rhizobiaceae bacterium]
MTRQIIAFFASSFLCVALSIPAKAEEKSGIVAAIDRDGALLTFSDGTTYVLPHGFDYDAVETGMEVHVILDAFDPAEVAAA